MTEPLTIDASATMLRDGTLTPSMLLEQCLKRLDTYEPTVHAWAFVDRERARHDAAVLSQELATGNDRGPLHGIPIGVKDIIDVYDMPTGCGSKRWANSFAREDAAVVARLRDAGALILGKTVTTAYAFTDPPITRNPWNANHTPGGSSSGSAAAVATGSCLAALGTQTGGSLIRPASYCGVYCLKPSHAHISVHGVLPLAPSLDHVGVLANSVLDLAIVYAALTNADLGSPTEPNRELIGFPDFFPSRAEPAMREGFARFRAATSDKKWQWREVTLPASFADVLKHHVTIMSVEAARVHAERLARHPDDYPAKIRDLIMLGSLCSNAEYEAAVDHRIQFAQEIDAILAETSGIIAVPATNGPAPSPETTGDFAFQSPWSYAGLPVVSLPIEHTGRGLPLAVALVGRRGQEVELLARADELAYDLGGTPMLPPVPV